MIAPGHPGRAHGAIPPERFGTTPEDAQLIVYAVHGRGQGSEFMRETAARIGLDGLAWIAPRADTSSWYPFGFLEEFESNQPMLGEALDTVGAQLYELRTTGPPVVVLGFSQGACLLAEYLLRSGDRQRAAILHTGGYIGPEEHDWPLSTDEFSGMPILLACADNDPWVPLHRATATAKAFREAGADVDFRVHPGEEHRIDDAAITAFRRLLTSIR